MKLLLETSLGAIVSNSRVRIERTPPVVEQDFPCLWAGDSQKPLQFEVLSKATCPTTGASVSEDTANNSPIEPNLSFNDHFGLIIYSLIIIIMFSVEIHSTELKFFPEHVHLTISSQFGQFGHITMIM